MATDIATALDHLANSARASGADPSAIDGIETLGGDPDFSRALPALSDLADRLATSGAGAEAQGEAIALLQRLRAAEAGGSRDAREGADAAPRELYGDLKAEYGHLFATCVIRPERSDLVAWHVRKLLAGQAAYARVGGGLGIPWYFVGIAHGLEASFRFDCHLHNGDPLSARTTHDPPGRPPVWNPPDDWDSSAVDAMTVEGFARQQDWSLPRTLYRWEAYNGFGSRRQGIHSPYLWSFSNNYIAGKYVKDKVWDPNAVSKQCGAAVMLKALVEGGHVATPAS